MMADAMEKVARKQQGFLESALSQAPTQQQQPPWEIVPRWHWRRWFGQGLRRRATIPERVMGRPRDHDKDWIYGNAGKVARDALEQNYGRAASGMGRQAR